MADDEAYTWGAFDRLITDCHVAWALDQDAIVETYRELRAIANRLTDLRTVPMKLDWMLQRRDLGELDPFGWMYFASSDINSFLTNLRALFDHLARAMRCAAPHPGGIPRSFNGLRKWAARETNDQARQLGTRQLGLVMGCDWFDELRALRDDLVHNDAHTLVFPREAGIAMQVYGRARALIAEPGLMLSESVVSFERFAAATMARLHVLLEESAEAMSDALPLNEPVGEGRSVHGGLRILAAWTDQYLSTLQ